MLEPEIKALRAVVNKRLEDLDTHDNPNLDRAIDSLCLGCRTIKDLVEMNARLTS